VSIKGFERQRDNPRPTKGEPWKEKRKPFVESKLLQPSKAKKAGSREKGSRATTRNSSGETVKRGDTLQIEGTIRRGTKPQGKNQREHGSS